MLPRALWIPTELIARAAEAIDEDEHGVRRTILRGMQLGLVWANRRPHLDAPDR